jgi:hypothetical protein
MALAPTEPNQSKIPADELYVLYKGINENKHLSRQYFTGRHADTIVQNQILANATDDLELSTGQLIAASIDAFSQNLTDKHNTRYHVPDDPQYDQVKLENAAAIDSIARLYYIQSPLMNDFIESAPLPVGLKSSEENALNDAFNNLSVGAKQLAGADMKASLEITSDLDFNDTIGVIQHALKEHGELMSNFKRPETDDLFRYDLRAPKASLAIFNDTLREHVNNNPELITDRLPPVAEKEEQTMAETTPTASNENLVDPLGLDDPMTEQAEAAREAAIDHQAVEISEQVAKNEQAQQQQPSPAPTQSMDDAMGGYPEDDHWLSVQDNGMPHDAPPPFDDVPDSLYEQEATQSLPDEPVADNKKPESKAKIVYIQGEDVEKANADLNFLTKSIEDNSFYGSGKIDVGAIEKSLQDANTKLNDAKPTPALRIAALHRSLETENLKIIKELNTPDHDPFDKVNGVFSLSRAAMGEVTRNQLNSSDNARDYIDPKKPPYVQSVTVPQREALDESLKSLPDSARQYALAETKSAMEKNDKFGFDDAVNTIRQSLHDFDETYKHVQPDANPSSALFERVIESTVEKQNEKAKANNADTISLPDFTPKPTNNTQTTAENTTTHTEGAKNEGAKNTDGARTDQEEKPEPDEEIDDPDNDRTAQQLPTKQGGFTLFNFSNSSNYTDVPKRSLTSAGLTATMKENNAIKPRNQKEEQPPKHSMTSAALGSTMKENDKIKPRQLAADEANADTHEKPIPPEPSANAVPPIPSEANAAPVEAPKPKPLFNDAMAQQDYEALNTFHEKLMSRYKDSDASDTYLHNETEAFLEKTEELAAQAETIMNKNQQDQEQLENIFKGLENVSKLKEELKEEADKKGFLDPEHSLNKEKGKDAEGKDKKGLGEKFDGVTEGLGKVMKGIGNFLSGLKNAFAGKGNKPQ